MSTWSTLPAFLLGALAPPALSGQTRPAADAELVSAIEHVLDAGPRATRVWSSFAPPDRFALCQRTDLTLVVTKRGSDSLPDNGAVVPLLRHPEHELRAFLGRLPGLPASCFTLRFQFAGRELLAFPALDSGYSLRGTRQVTAVAVLHEWFHVFQRTAFSGTRSGIAEWSFDVHEAGEALPRDTLTSPTFQALAGKERALLAFALEAPTRDSIVDLLRTYVGLRATRMRSLPPRLRGVEPHEERKEGTAQYAAYRTALVTSESGEEIVAAMLGRDLRALLDFANGTWRSWHIYASGAALGVLLDRLGCDWQPAVAAGATLFGAVAQVLDLQSAIADVSTAPPDASPIVCGRGTT